MTLQVVVDEFLTAGRAGGWSSSTVDQYRWHLTRWVAWMAARGVVDVDQVTAALLRQYGAEQADGYAPATRRVAAIAVRSLLRWCVDEELLSDAKLAEKIKIPRAPRLAQRTMRTGEVDALLAACDAPVQRGLTGAQGEATRLRNAAMISLMFDAFLRAHELCGLRLEHLDLAGLRVTVNGKGGKREFIRFGPETAERLRAWLAVRCDYARCDALFVGITGNTPGMGLTTPGLRGIMRALGKRAGVEGVSPHAFRRGAAVAALEAGAPSRWVQAQGRWEDLRMVDLYSQRLETDRAFDRWSPVGQLNGHNGRPNGAENPDR